jgi:hypothetical protein
MGTKDPTTAPVAAPAAIEARKPPPPAATACTGSLPVAMS